MHIFQLAPKISNPKDLDLEEASFCITGNINKPLKKLSLEELYNVCDMSDQSLINLLCHEGFNVSNGMIFFPEKDKSRAITASSIVYLYTALKQNIYSIDYFLSKIYHFKEEILNAKNNNLTFNFLPDRVVLYLQSESKNIIGKHPINYDATKNTYVLRSRDDIFCSILEKLIPVPSQKGGNIIAQLLFEIFKVLHKSKAQSFFQWLKVNKKSTSSDKDKAYIRAIKNLSKVLVISEEYFFETYAEYPKQSHEAIANLLKRVDFKNYYYNSSKKFPKSYLDDGFYSAANKELLRFFQENKSTLTPPTPQLILQGPPGTGKSHQLDARLNEYGIDQDSDRFERVVGHPELTSADFIGQYRPMTKGADKELEYCFVPGPFTRLLKQAFGDSKQAYILIIEELNRTNAAAMFAEVFQLLDRRDDGQSKYGVNLGADVNRYLLKQEDGEDLDDYEERISRHKVRLPANFAIWATMNTADQGVFPMDTAFKRRWSFEYLGVNEGEEVWGQADPQKPNPWNPMIMDDGSMDWQSLRKGINQVLSQHGKDEDRQLGGFFLTQRELGWDPINDCLVDNHLAIIQQNIMTKVIGYLRDDVLRYEPHVLFVANEQQAVLGFSGLISQMKREGILSVFRASDVQTWRTEFQEYIARHQSVNPTTDESDPNLTEERQEDTQENTQEDTPPDTQQEQQNPADSDDENQD